MIFFNFHDLTFSELLNFGHLVVVALFPDALNYSSISEVYFPMSIKFIVFDSSDIKFIALFPFVVAILYVGLWGFVASDDSLVGF